MQEIIADLAPPITKALKKLMCPETREIPLYSQDHWHVSAIPSQRDMHKDYLPSASDRAFPFEVTEQQVRLLSVLMAIRGYLLQEVVALLAGVVQSAEERPAVEACGLLRASFT